MYMSELCVPSTHRNSVFHKDSQREPIILYIATPQFTTILLLRESNHLQQNTNNPYTTYMR